jgi:hypothetical protein
VYNRLLKQRLNEVYARQKRFKKNFNYLKAESTSESTSRLTSSEDNDDSDDDSDDEEEATTTRTTGTNSGIEFGNNDEDDDDDDAEDGFSDNADMVVNKDETASMAVVPVKAATVVQQPRLATATLTTTSLSHGRLAALSSASRNSMATASAAKMSDVMPRSVSNSNSTVNSSSSSNAGTTAGLILTNGKKTTNITMSKELKKSLINELLNIVTFAKTQGKDYAKKIDTLKQEANDLNRKRVDLSEKDKMIK